MPRMPAPACLYCEALAATPGSECPECGRGFEEVSRPWLMGVALAGGLGAIAVVVTLLAAS